MHTVCDQPQSGANIYCESKKHAIIYRHDFGRMLTDLKNSFTNFEIKLQQDLCHISHRCNKAHVMLSRDERRHIREACRIRRVRDDALYKSTFTLIYCTLLESGITCETSAASTFDFNELLKVFMGVSKFGKMKNDIRRSCMR